MDRGEKWEEGAITVEPFFFLHLFGISSPCAKFQSGEALAVFVEKKKKRGREAISPERDDERRCTQTRTCRVHAFKRQRSEGERSLSG